MNEKPKTDRAFVFDFGRVVFRWRPEVLVAQVLPHRAADAGTTAHWTREIFQAYEGDWQHFDRGTVEAAELAQRIAARTGLGAHEVLALVEACPAELEP